ncbi:MAG: glycerophosphodiester phosphodiesterase [Pseudomonadales bacterium]|nr:glycerophosphodiester phosphodiesterase [Pseudomonadales bacterium]
MPRIFSLFLVILSSLILTACDDDDDNNSAAVNAESGFQVGPRPFFLVEDMDEGELKTALQSCENGPFVKTDFSIGHRGAPMQFPEHTRESYVAAAKMGAGIVECDVTFTADRQLVCRHSQCDLHTTTNILAKPELAEKCSTPFSPADAASGTAATAQCCTSDITLAEFKSLCGKMDASDATATTVEQYMKGTADWRTDLYSACGTLMTHAESIELFKSLDVKMTPELKSPSVAMPFEGDYTQEDYAQQMIDEYKAAGVDPENVYAQSFNLQDVLYWIQQEPAFGQQGVYLDDRVYNDPSFTPSLADFEQLAAQGVKIVAPPMYALLTLDADERIVPSEYATLAKAAGLEIITWTLERDGPLAQGGGWYHQSIASQINNDGDTMTVLDVLAKQVGVKGIFSDWPGTVTYYASCMDMK